MDIEERSELFRKEIEDVGGLIYTKELLSRFYLYWSEPSKRKKMRYEMEKTWDLSRRLALWARNNYDNIQCFLSESQKTIKQKRHAFAISLEPYLPKYGRDVLNAFFNDWTTPENKPNPAKLRWEEQQFWGLETKLQEWVARNEKPRF